MRLFLEIVVTGLAVALAAYIVPGVFVANFVVAILVGIAIGVINSTIGSLLQLLALPITVLTLGLFGIVIGVLMILLTDQLIVGFSVAGFWSAFWFGIVFGLLKVFFGGLFR